MQHAHVAPGIYHYQPRHHHARPHSPLPALLPHNHAPLLHLLPACPPPPGTPGYMSPELLSTAIKPARYDGAKADIWALGIMLCQMFFDKVPFLPTKIHRLPLHEQVSCRGQRAGLAALRNGCKPAPLRGCIAGPRCC
jgi:serine/threonine protein kinase